jgi:hypothetical protein
VNNSAQPNYKKNLKKNLVHSIKKSIPLEYDQIKDKISGLRIAIRLLREEFEKLPENLQEIVVKELESEGGQ